MDSSNQVLTEETLETEIVFQGTLLKVYKDQVALPNGITSSREYISHPGAVMIMAQLPSGAFLFGRQFRYPLKRDFLEFPAGKIDPAENPAQAAARELHEETGYNALSMRHLGVLHPCVGYSNEKIEIFYTDDLEDTGAQKLDVGESFEVERLTLEEACIKVFAGEITDAKTIVGLFWAKKINPSG